MSQNLITLIKKSNNIFLDTSCFIYTVEENPKYHSLTKKILNMISDKEIKATTSVITLGELLAKPLKENNILLATLYKNILTKTEGLTTFSIDTLLATNASQISAKYGIKLLDSIQLSVAIKNECQIFLTNDKGLKKCKEITVLILEDFI